MSDDAIKLLHDVLEEIKFHLGRHTPLRRAETFLLVACHQPVSLRELAAYSKVPRSTIYNDLEALTDPARPVVRRAKPETGGTYRYSLSLRGQVAAKALEGLLAGSGEGLLEEDEEDEFLDRYFEAVQHTRV